MDNLFQQKENIFRRMEDSLKSFVRVRYIDKTRPWGGFIVINEDEAEAFIRHYFPSLTREKLDISGKLSPKLLLVEPGKKLSWQYHHRRAEIWKLLEGDAILQTSETDEPGEEKNLEIGDVVELPQGTRHRLIGDQEWSVIAEIWRHTDRDNPSDEEDIIRLQDDFGRK